MREFFGENGPMRRPSREELPLAMKMVALSLVTVALLAASGVPLAVVAIGIAGFVPVLGFFGVGLVLKTIARERK